MKWLLVLLLAFAGAWSIRADDTKIRQAVEKGIVTGQFLQTLTPDDVPEKWKVREETREKDNYTARTYSRGGVKVLMVQWPKGTKPGMEKMFTATLYHGGKSLTTVTHMGDSTNVLPPDASKGYKVFTAIKDDGTVSVTAMKDDDTFFESIVIRGRDTRPIDDLDYTKAALAMEGITKPLMEALQGKLDEKPAKARDEKPPDN